jgi:hypothetical protein
MFALCLSEDIINSEMTIRRGALICLFIQNQIINNRPKFTQRILLNKIKGINNIILGQKTVFKDEYQKIKLNVIRPFYYSKSFTASKY